MSTTTSPTTTTSTSSTDTSTTGALTESQIAALSATPVASMPTSGTATYAGQANFPSAVTYNGASDLLTADLSVTADFANKTVSGTLTNYKDAEGQFGFSTTSASGTGTVTDNSINLPMTGTTTFNKFPSGSFTTNLTANVTLSGGFKGDSAQAMDGTIAANSDTTTQIGTFYANKQ